MLIARARDWDFTMNSEADSAPFFHLASPPQSPGGSPILPISQSTPPSASSPTGVDSGPTYNITIIPTLGIKALSAILAFFAFLILILGENDHDSFIVAEIFLVLQSMWSILMIAGYYLRSSQRRHANEANEKKIRFVDMGLIVGLMLSLSVGYLVFAGTRRWYYSNWNWFWGCLPGWIVV
jgi:hypothetical protein